MTRVVRTYWRPLRLVYLTRWERLVEGLTGWTRMEEVRVWSRFNSDEEDHRPTRKRYWDKDVVRYNR